MKLKYYFGIDGRLLKFIENYLYVREQFVVLRDAKSSSKPVLSVVPQESILCPIFFLMFINDLPPLSYIQMMPKYGGLSTLWLSIDRDILQKNIDNLNDWAIKNRKKISSTEVPFCFVKYS